jgi:short-subunit dehydrogenase
MPLNPRIPSFAGRRVWIIGASSGIGAALARELARRDARLALSARSAEKLADVARGTEALVLPLDVTQAASVHAAARQLLSQWNGLDLVLVVAGTHVAMRAQTWDLARARSLLDVNLLGVLNCVDAVLPTLLAQRSGGLGIVSSVAGYIGLPKALIYGASKAALINFCESLYGDLQPLGIATYLIDPGFVATPLTARNDFTMPALMRAEDAARATVEGIAAGRFEIHYPQRFTRWLKLLRILPYPLQFAAVRRFTRI